MFLKELKTLDLVSRNYCPETAELQIWNANGSLHVGKTNDNKAVLELPYQGANNAHVLEAAIRTKFKTGNPRLSSIFDD